MKLNPEHFISIQSLNFENDESIAVTAHNSIKTVEITNQALFNFKLTSVGKVNLKFQSNWSTNVLCREIYIYIFLCRNQPQICGSQIYHTYKEKPNS